MTYLIVSEPDFPNWKEPDQSSFMGFTCVQVCCQMLKFFIWSKKLTAGPNTETKEPIYLKAAINNWDWSYPLGLITMQQNWLYCPPAASNNFNSFFFPLWQQSKSKSRKKARTCLWAPRKQSELNAMLFIAKGKVSAWGILFCFNIDACWSASSLWELKVRKTRKKWEKRTFPSSHSTMWQRWLISNGQQLGMLTRYKISWSDLEAFSLGKESQ